MQIWYAPTYLHMPLRRKIQNLQMLSGEIITMEDADEPCACASTPAMRRRPLAILRSHPSRKGLLRSSSSNFEAACAGSEPAPRAPSAPAASTHGDPAEPVSPDLQPARPPEL